MLILVNKYTLNLFDSKPVFKSLKCIVRVSVAKHSA